MGEGSAIITATAGGKSATCEVAVEISYVTIDGNKATVQLEMCIRDRDSGTDDVILHQKTI